MTWNLPPMYIQIYLKKMSEIKIILPILYTYIHRYPWRKNYIHWIIIPRYSTFQYGYWIAAHVYIYIYIYSFILISLFVHIYDVHMWVTHLLCCTCIQDQRRAKDSKDSGPLPFKNWQHTTFLLGQFASPEAKLVGGWATHPSQNLRWKSLKIIIQAGNIWRQH